MAGDGPEPESVLVVDGDGRRLVRSAAVAAIVGQWRLIGHLAAAVMRRSEAPLDTVYDFVARNRQALGAPIRLGRRVATRLRA